MAELIYLPVADIYPHPDNPRKDLGDLTELADSIKVSGVLQNLTVVNGHKISDDEWRDLAKEYEKTPSEKIRSAMNGRYTDDGYTVIIGHRRLAAAKLAGLESVPCVIADMSPKEQAKTMLMENIQRSDLTVYEQARGFQLMLNMGETVESIAKETGFSTTTVRRRVKMAELDPEKLKKVSTRQLSLGDFDSLAQIEDINERNKVLESIGTKDFEFQVKVALNAQAVKKNMPAVKKWLRDKEAKKINHSDTWGGKYDPYPGATGLIYIAKWGEEGNKPPEKTVYSVFYYMDDNSLRLYKKHERAKPAKKSEAELAKEKTIDEAWKALDETAATAHELRKQFVENLTVTGKNRANILIGALYAGLAYTVDYNSPDRNAALKDLDLSDVSYNNRSEKLADAVENLKDKTIPALVYRLFGDDKPSACTGTAPRKYVPRYKRDVKLELLYKWLIGLGYQMSTEEEKLLNGEHKGYHALEEPGTVDDEVSDGQNESEAVSQDG